MSNLINTIQQTFLGIVVKREKIEYQKPVKYRE